MRIAVCGLGYVGTVSAACLAADGHDVIGVDVDAGKVGAINSGSSPVVEPGLSDLVAEQSRLGRLRATTDLAEAVARSSMALVCVGTPSNQAGGLDLRFVERVVVEIGRAIREKRPDRYVVVVRSTVLPGTVEDVLVPLLEESSERRLGKSLGVAMNPEFLREGSAIRDYKAPPKTVVGATDAATANEVASLYGSLDAPLECVPIRVAEMVKYADNAFHALKVAFTNELANIASASRVDAFDVMRVFSRDTKLNLSSAYLKPGYAFGGSCLPKDLRALVRHARRNDVSTPLLNGILESNEEQKRVGLRAVQRLGKKRVGVLGLAFKAGTDDLRESPIVELVEMLLGKGYDIRIFDRNVSLARLVGSNRAYIERELPHLGSLLVDTIPALLAHAEVVVIANPDPEFGGAVQELRDDQAVVDLVGLTRKPPGGSSL